MPTTSTGLPYPASTDTPDVPRDIQALAVAIDSHERAYATSTAHVYGTGTGPVSTTVTFPAGKFTAPPSIVCGLQSTSIVDTVYVGSVTATGCTVFTSRKVAGSAGTQNILVIAVGV